MVKNRPECYSPPMPPSVDQPHIDDVNQCIWRAGKRVSVTPKAWAVLQRLRDHPGQLVAKQDLLTAVWPDAHVIDVVLNNAIAQLRAALGDHPKGSRFIETVHRRGYRWIGPPTNEVATFATIAPGAQRIVGRSAALSKLHGYLARANAAQRQMVFITGEAGIGKTALIDELLRSLAAQLILVESPPPATPDDQTVNDLSTFLFGRGRCIETQGAGEPYRAVFDALEDLLSNDGEDIRDCFKKHAPTWLLQMPSVMSADELEALQRNATSSGYERMQREIERALEASAAHRTIVLVLDDLHWADTATVELLWALATRREAARLMIIGTYRPVDAIADQHPVIRLRHELGSKRQCAELVIDGLDTQAVREYLAHRYVGHALPDTFATVLQSQTSGNPLFLLNALEDLEQRGWLIEHDGIWCSTADLAMVGGAVPDSTRAIIDFRFDRLPQTSRELLEVASVVGLTFATQTVAAAAERTCAELEAECETLSRSAHFLHPGVDVEWPDGSRGRQHEFRHALYQQVLYGRVAPTRRQLLHRRIAERLAAGYSDRLPEVARQLSFHCERAGDLMQAVDWIELLVKQAQQRSAMVDVAALLEHAVALQRRLSSHDDQRRRLLQLTINHGVALASVRGGDNQQVRQVFEQARALAASVTIEAEHVVALGFAALTDILSGRLREACSLGEQQLVLGGAQASGELVFNANTIIGMAQLYLGEIGPALTHMKAAFAAREAGLSPSFAMPIYDPLVQLQMAFGLAQVLSEREDIGWPAVLSGLQRARNSEIAAYLGPALSRAIGIAIVRGDLVSARAFATELLLLCESNALPLWREAARVQLTWIDLRETRDPTLLEPLRAAVQDFRATGSLGAPRMLSMLADGYLIADRFDEASRALDLAFDTRGQECVFDAELFRQRAAILTACAGKDRGQLELAEQLLDRAIEIAASQGTRLFESRAKIDLAQLTALRLGVSPSR